MADSQLLFALVAGRYSAHLGEGGPLSAIDIAFIVAGSAVAIGGFLLLNMKPSSDTGLGRFRKLGAPLLAIGLCVVALGPGLLHRGNCAETPQGAAIEIASPRPRQEFKTTQVVVSVETTGAHLADLWSGKDRPESAHLLLKLDGKTVSSVDATEQTVDALPGDHELMAELVSSDRAPFCSRVTDKVKFSVVE